MPITDDYIEQIKKKIAEGSNGDVDYMILTLVYANYKAVTEMACNPAFRFGTFLKENKGLSAFLGFITYLLTVLIPELLLKLLGIDVSKLLP